MKLIGNQRLKLKSILWAKIKGFEMHKGTVFLKSVKTEREQSEPLSFYTFDSRYKHGICFGQLMMHFFILQLQFSTTYLPY